MIINEMPGLALGTTTASASDLLDGKTAYDGNGDLVTGTMSNRGAYTSTTSYGGSVTIPAGYHNGSGAITGGTFNFSGATITADKVLTGYKGYNSSGSLITGTYTPITPTVEITTSNNVTVTGTLSGTSTTVSANSGSSGIARLYPTSLGNWTFTASRHVGISITISSTTLYTRFLGMPIGGTICGKNSNGNTYRFFDSNGNEVVEGSSLRSLANAYAYIQVSGTATTPTYFVYSSDGLVSSKIWGKYGTSIGITGDGIGVGKTNTATALTKTGWESNSVFAYITTCRNNNLGGCNDWFIASKAEQDLIRNAGVVTWYSSNLIWSSVEFSSNNAYYWRYYGSNWPIYDKYDSYCAFAARAF